MKKIRNFFTAIKLSVQISFTASKAILFFRIIVTIISTFIPFLNLYCSKQIINAIIIGDDSIYQWLIVLGITQILLLLLGRVTEFLSSIHNEHILMNYKKLIIDQMNSLDLSFYDNPETYDMLHIVTTDQKSIPSFIWNCLDIVKNILSLISSIAILMSLLNVFSPFFIIVSCLPLMILDKKYSLELYNWNINSTMEQRKMNYVFDILTNKYYAKEIRVNCIFEKMNEKYKKLWELWYTKKKKVLNKKFIFTSIAALMPNIIIIYYMFYIVYKIKLNLISVGDFSYLIGVINQLTTGVFTIIALFSSIIQQRTHIDRINQFLNWKPKYNKIDTIELDKFISLEFKNVYFSYPNAPDRFVLNNVSFKINKGDKIAILGENGSGKSTILKLMLGLYVPTTGEILINGHNILKVDNESYYSLLSVMFQDYANFFFTYKDNLCLNQEYSKDRIEETISKSCLAKTIQKWSLGIDTPLSKTFYENGVELSGGEWQKVALSRMFIKNADLLVLDEPLSAIDIKSDSLIHNNIIMDSNDRSLIMITHKLYDLSKFDTIIVLSNGEIVESGNHNFLLSKQGIYSELYSIQSKRINS